MAQFELSDPLNMLGGLKPPIQTVNLGSFAQEPEIVKILSCLFIQRARIGSQTREFGYIDLVNRFMHENQLGQYDVLKVYGASGHASTDLNSLLTLLFSRYKREDTSRLKHRVPDYITFKARYQLLRDRPLPARELYRSRKILSDWLTGNGLGTKGLLMPLNKIELKEETE